MYCQYNLTTSPIEIHDPASLPSMAISPLNNIFITYQYNPSSVGTQYLQEVDPEHTSDTNQLSVKQYIYNRIRAAF